MLYGGKAVGEGLGVGVAVPLALGDGLRVGVGLTLPDGLGDGEGLGLALTEGVGVCAVLVGDALGDGLDDAVEVGVATGPDALPVRLTIIFFAIAASLSISIFEWDDPFFEGSNRTVTEYGGVCPGVILKLPPPDWIEKGGLGGLTVPVTAPPDAVSVNNI